MQNLSRTRVAGIALAACAVAVLTSGCATMQGGSVEQLQSRAQQYWKAKVDGDLTAAFQFEEWNARKQLTLRQYLQGNPPMFLKAEVTDAKVVSQDRGEVTTEVQMLLPFMMTTDPMDSTLVEKWYFIDGQWYHHTVSTLPGRQE